MTIGIDIRVLTRGTRTGVEEYTINLLSHLLPLDQNTHYKLFYNSFKKTDIKYPWFFLNNVKLKDFRVPNRLFFLGARYLKWPKIDKLLGDVDVYFNPHFFTAPVSSKCKKVIVFHDLSFEHHPEFFSRRKRLWQKALMNTKRDAQNANKIIASSISTKNDLINLYKIDSNKIKVIYLGVGKQFKVQDNNLKLEIIRKKYKLPKNFILYFGTIEPRKNLVGLIKSFELLREKIDCNLVIAGSRGWLYNDILKTAKNSKYSKNIIFTGFVEEADKACLYNLADLFVYPSFFEGFGFPPLEAMACGVPTIVSYTSSLPEVVGDSALMIDPYNVDELAWAMEIALKDLDLRKRLSQKGIRQAKKFSWQKCAQEVLKTLISW